MEMNVDIGRIAARYPGRGQRESLQAVADLRAMLPQHAQPPAIAVVGTNGKTSTATYLDRLLSAGGVRTGRYTSPHLSAWGERVTIAGVPSAETELAETLEEVHELAVQADLEHGELRFFDVLTLAAELLFARRGAELVVYEAGIGGRLDAVRLLRPRLTLLTAVGRDHAEILGDTLEQILREKLLVAPAGGAVLSLQLPAQLKVLAEGVADENGFELGWVDAAPAQLPAAAAELAAPLHRSLSLALAGRRWAESHLAVPPLAEREMQGIDLDVPGRYQRGRRAEVPYLLDSAHNEAAWRELVTELERRPLGSAGEPLVALVSLSPDKDRRALARALTSLPRLEAVIATRHLELPAVDPEALAVDLRAAELEVEVAMEPRTAVALTFERASHLGAGVVVLGSTHLAGEVGREL
ncbi:MAG TPA: Mur ligase family protein [Solirubrobacterales bacterium]|jgi:dihydrofolate synthase/folylpolyglutamate synthase|nr:Mur ligase family protein [Solirubrobacterales bacterium]